VTPEGNYGTEEGDETFWEEEDELYVRRMLD
jgi:hypothetical protein